jgi:hypothetical protein
MPKVSIVSVFYNRAGFVDRTVESLLRQDYPDFDIVLVDDGSTDGTLKALRANEGGRVRVIAQANKGFTAAIGSAIAALDCEYIAIQGSGDSSYPSRLRLQAEALDSNPRLAVVGGGIDVVEPSTGRIVREWDKPIGQPAAQVMLGPNPFSHGETMYRAKTYRECGGYRDFFTFAQDRDLFCRMSRRGEFYRISEKIYARLSFIPGSVSAKPMKRIQQILLSAFAVHCHGEALAGRPDPLDAYGPIAALSIGRSAVAQKAILRAALRSLAHGDYQDAVAYARFLHGYAPGPTSTLVLTMCKTRAAAHRAQTPQSFGAGAKRLT